MSEAELLNILVLHKQQTMSVWGTRQSPSPAKPATRLMWKSQYVPYDGIPFVNAGKSVCYHEGIIIPNSYLHIAIIMYNCGGETWHNFAFRYLKSL